MFVDVNDLFIYSDDTEKITEIKSLLTEEIDQDAISIDGINAAKALKLTGHIGDATLSKVLGAIEFPHRKIQLLDELGMSEEALVIARDDFAKNRDIASASRLLQKTYDTEAMSVVQDGVDEYDKTIFDVLSRRASRLIKLAQHIQENSR